MDRVCLAYLRRFGARSQAVIQHERFRRILGREASQELFRLLEGPSRHFRTGLARRIPRHLGSLNGAGRGRLYLNVGHTGLNSSGFRDWVSRTDVRPVYLVHDLIPITHPQFCRLGEDVRHRERMITVLKTGSGVIGNSKATLDDLTLFARKEGIATPPLLPAWLGAENPRPRPANGSGRPTFVVLGTIEGRKNHFLLLKVWSRLIANLGSDAPRLIIIGQRGWEAEETFKLLDQDLTLRNHVTELNHCSDEDLARHLASARALLFPSFAEGYGLPLVEALGSGIPVIASDLQVFREIGGVIPTYLSPFDDRAWEEAILEHSARDSIARSAQIERMKEFQSPSWDGHFRAVEAWLDTLS